MVIKEESINVKLARNEKSRLILELSSNDFSNLKSSLRMSLAFLPRSLYLGGAIPDRKREGCRMIRQMAWVAYNGKMPNFVPSTCERQAT
jgi:hypothetical protein